MEEAKKSRESLEISLEKSLKNSEYAEVKIRAIQYIRGIWPAIFAHYDPRALKMIDNADKFRNLRIINTEIFANFCIHIRRWKNDGLVSPAYHLIIIIDAANKIYYAWRNFDQYKEHDLPFSDQELPLRTYTSRKNQNKNDDFDICGLLEIDPGGVVLREGRMIPCHRSARGAYQNRIGEYYCSTACDKCHIKSSVNEIRRTCDIYGICLGNDGNTIRSGSLNMRLRKAEDGF